MTAAGPWASRSTPRGARESPPAPSSAHRGEGGSKAGTSSRAWEEVIRIGSASTFSSDPGPGNRAAAVRASACSAATWAGPEGSSHSRAIWLSTTPCSPMEIARPGGMADGRLRGGSPARP